MALETWLLIAVTAFFLGYIIGHRHGRVEGFRDGVVFAPIEMRRSTLERGRCMICGTGTRRAPEPGAGGKDEVAEENRRSPPKPE